MLALFKLTRYIIDDWYIHQNYRYMVCLNQIKTIGYSKKKYIIMYGNIIKKYIWFYYKYWKIKADKNTLTDSVSYKLSIRNGSKYEPIHIFERDNKYIINRNGYNYCFNNYRDGIFNTCQVANKQHVITYLKVDDRYIPDRIKINEECTIIKYYKGHYFQGYEYELSYNRDFQLTMIYEKNYDKLYIL